MACCPECSTRGSDPILGRVKFSLVEHLIYGICKHGHRLCSLDLHQLLQAVNMTSIRVRPSSAGGRCPFF